MESETTASGKPEGQIQIVAQSHCKSGSWVVTNYCWIEPAVRGSAVQIHNIESGEAEARAKVLAKMAKVSGLDLDDLT